MRRYNKEEKAEILKEVESLGNVSLVSRNRIHYIFKKLFP